MAPGEYKAEPIGDATTRDEAFFSGEVSLRPGGILNPSSGFRYPQCPFCGKLKTLHKAGAFYCCKSCHRMTLKFEWGK